MIIKDAIKKGAGGIISSSAIKDYKNKIIKIQNPIKFLNHFGKPKKFNIVELGPGDGSLMKILLKSFKKFPEFNSTKKIFL